MPLCDVDAYAKQVPGGMPRFCAARPDAKMSLWVMRLNFYPTPRNKHKRMNVSDVKDVKRGLNDLDRVVMLNSRIAGTGYLLAFIGYACCHFAKTSRTAHAEMLTALFYLGAALAMGIYLWELRQLCVHAQATDQCS